MNFYSEKQVYKLLEQQRIICQEDEDKRAHTDFRGCFVHVEDILESQTPKFPVPELIITPNMITRNKKN